MSDPDWELAPVGLPFEVASMDPTPAGDPVAQDGGFILYPQAGVDEEPRFVSAQEIREAMDELKTEMKGIMSAGMNFVPGVGQLKNVIEAFAGQDLITGDHLAWWERGLNLAAAIPHVHGAEGVVHIVGEIGHTAHQVNMGVHGVHGAEAVNGALDVVTGRTHD